MVKNMIIQKLSTKIIELLYASYALSMENFYASEMILRRGIYELTSDSKTIEPYGFYGSHVCSQESHGL